VSFARSGVSVASGATHVWLSLRAIGYGASLTPLGEVPPHLEASRVVYGRARVREWYVNGPLGLEQGFTIPMPPGPAAGALTLSIALSGNVHASVAADGQSVTLSRAGQSVLSYSGLSATDARGRALHSWLQLHAGRLLLRVDARDARYPLRLDPLLQQGEKLTAAGATGNSEFGTSVALSADGDTALIGAPADGGVGAAWVFTRSGTTWTQQGEKLTGSGEIGHGEFGKSVALSADGDTALIGGRGDGGDVGAAWIFTRVGETWSQQGGKLTGGGEVGDGDFGASVALSADGNTALIGGFDDDKEIGAAWVFTRAGETWSQQGEKLTGGGGCGTPFFGTSVALSADGDTALIGGPVDCDTGAAWVFTRSGSTWTQQGEKLSGGQVFGAWREFGERVALSAEGETALIGGSGDDHDRGGAWVFTRSGASWTQQGPMLTASGAIGTRFFGHSVALSSDGETALIGGTYGDTGFPGAAWTFTHTQSGWTQQGERLAGSGENVEGFFGIDGADFGASVALSSDASTALIGGGANNRLLGGAWVFVNQPANPPRTAQYGRCLLVPSAAGERLRGEYANAACTKVGRRRTYEWYPGGASTGFTSKLTRGRATLETVRGSKVTCKTETGAGEYTATGLTTVGGVVLTFTGCERLGEKCATAEAAEGTITTTPLEGELGITRLGKTRAKDNIGLDLFPVGRTGSVMEFDCGAVPVSVRGSMIVPLHANRMALRTKLNFSAAKGKQKPESFVGGPHDVLEVSFNKGPFEQAGLSAKTTQANREALEVNSVL
jgi:hypothetical protein